MAEGLSAGGGTPAEAAAAGPLPPLPDPLKPLPPDALYGHEVLARLRLADSDRARRRLWKDEFVERKVAGQGRVTFSEMKDVMGALHWELRLDLDADFQDDMVIRLLSPDMAMFGGVGEGATIWYEGTLKDFDRQVIVAGDWVEVPF